MGKANTDQMKATCLRSTQKDTGGWKWGRSCRDGGEGAWGFSVTQKKNHKWLDAKSTSPSKLLPCQDKEQTLDLRRWQKRPQANLGINIITWKLKSNMNILMRWKQTLIERSFHILLRYKQKLMDQWWAVLLLLKGFLKRIQLSRGTPLFIIIIIIIFEGLCTVYC